MASILGQIWRAIGLRLWNRGLLEYESMIADCERAVDSVSELLPPENADDVRSYFYAREACLGVETLIAKLYDMDARLSSEQFKSLEIAAIAVGVGNDRMSSLRELAMKSEHW
ncbi:MAG: hypothetical protein IAG10_20900 [Planctomycetaceae bacterium]|nr:hypothetical protein [Planctomycetaceae bacterium]